MQLSEPETEAGDNFAMNVRLRRLKADYNNLCGLTAGNPYIKLVSAEGNPPEKYTLEFHVRGMTIAEDGSPQVSTLHRAEVFLPLDYPRRPPFCRMITPLFHPNINPQKICIGDHWSAGQSLSQMVIRIAEMICFQSYNVKSPLNAVAAKWAEDNLGDLPLERIDLQFEL